MRDEKEVTLIRQGNHIFHEIEHSPARHRPARFDLSSENLAGLVSDAWQGVDQGFRVSFFILISSWAVLSGSSHIILWAESSNQVKLLAGASRKL